MLYDTVRRLQIFIENALLDISHTHTQMMHAMDIRHLLSKKTHTQERNIHIHTCVYMCMHMDTKHTKDVSHKYEPCMYVHTQTYLHVESYRCNSACSVVPYTRNGFEALHCVGDIPSVSAWCECERWLAFVHAFYV